MRSAAGGGPKDTLPAVNQKRSFFKMSFNKYFYKRIVAAVAALAMAVAATGCGESTSWIAQCSDTKINSGVYIFYQTEAYSDATSLLRKENEELNISDTKLLKTMAVENTDITEWINSKAEKNLKIFAAVNQKFSELGLSLTEEEKAQIDAVAEMYWQYNAAMYEENGIGESTFRQLVEFDTKKEEVFLHYYGEGGEKECPDSEITAYLEGNYARVKTIRFDLNASDGTALEGDEKAAVKKMAEDYKKQADSGKKTFDQLISEYDDYKAKLAEEEEKAEAEDTDSSEEEEAAVTTAPAVTEAAETSETTVSDETSEEAEETEAAEETEEAEESEDAEETEETEEAVTTAAESEDEDPAVTSEAAEEEQETEDDTAEDDDADPYRNESIWKKGSEENGYSPSEKVNTAVFTDCEVNGDTVIVEDEENSCIYLIQRLDVADRTDFFEGDRKTGILTEMFKDEFDNMAAGWADGYNFAYNEAAKKRYNPFNIKF